MKRQTPTDRYPLAPDQYEWIMAHHKDLLAEAERMRLYKEIPAMAKPRRRLFKTLLNGIGSHLIALGEWLKEIGSTQPPQEDLAFLHQEDL